MIHKLYRYIQGKSFFAIDNEVKKQFALNISLDLFPENELKLEGINLSKLEGKKFSLTGKIVKVWHFKKLAFNTIESQNLDLTFQESNKGIDLEMTGQAKLGYHSTPMTLDVQMVEYEPKTEFSLNYKLRDKIKIATFFKLISNFDIKHILPSELLSLSNEFIAKKFQIDLLEFSIPTLVISGEVSCSKDWVIVKNQLVLEHISLLIELTRVPSGDTEFPWIQYLSLSLSTKLVIEEDAIDTTVVFSGDVVTINLSTVKKSLLPSIPSLLGWITGSPSLKSGIQDAFNWIGFSVDFDQMEFSFNLKTKKFERILVKGKFQLFDNIRGTYLVQDAGGSWIIRCFNTTRPLMTLGQMVNELAKKVGLKNILPSFLSSLTISSITLQFQDGQKGFSLTTQAGLKLGKKSLLLTLSINTQSKNSSELIGVIIINKSVFEIDFEKSKGNETIIAKFQVTKKKNYLYLTDLLFFFGFDTTNIPEALNFALKSATLTYTDDKGEKSVELDGTFKDESLQGKFTLLIEKNKATKKTEFLAMVDLQNATLPIPKDLPVVHAHLYDDLKLSLSSLVFASAETTVNNNTYPAGISIAGTIKFFDYQKDIHINIAGGHKHHKKHKKGASLPVGEGALVLAKAATPTKPPIKWFNINKNVGPVALQKIGFEYEDSELSLLVDVSATLGGLNFGLQGLSIKTPLKFPPELDDLSFGLDGVSLAYTGKTIAIGGAFLKSPKIPNYYSGLAFVRAGKLAIDAIGGYGEDKKKGTSLFVFASIDIPIGGPPIFFVTGFSLGFGYNMSLNLPKKAADIPNFPLLSTSLFSGIKPDDVSTALKKIDQAIYPTPNEYWFAVGIHFQSFDLIQSQLLLTVDIEKEIIALLGVSLLEMPKGDDNPFINVALGIIVSYNIKEGILKADAALSTNSYILNQDCKIFGEFAFYAWFKGAHAGNFVLSLGGYHPKFVVPAYYPTVQRVGFDWRIGSKIDIGGSTYFALTPSSVMAGINLHLTFNEGGLKAWLKADADFLVQWKPFHYDAFVSIDIGASYESFKLDIGATLHLFGPPFAGKVHVDLTVVSFTIHIGEKVGKPNLLDWTAFEKSFLLSGDASTLPQMEDSKKSSGVNSINLVGGLLKKIPIKKGSKDKIWVVRADDLAFSVQSKIPCTAITFGPKGQAIPSTSLPHFINNDNQLGLRPMGSRNLKKVALNVSFTGVTGKGEHDPTKLQTWEWAVQNMGVPEAIWSPNAVNPKVPKADVIEATTGLSKISPKGYVPQSKLSANIASFKALIIYQKIYLSPQTNLISTQGKAATNAYQTIRNTINQTAVKGERTKLIEQVNQIFGLSGKETIKDDMTNYAHELEAYLVGAPQLGKITYQKGGAKAIPLKTGKLPKPSPEKQIASLSLANAWVQQANTAITDYTQTQRELFQQDEQVFVYPSLSYLFDLVSPGSLATKLDYSGTNRLQLLCFDEFDNLLTCAITNKAIKGLSVGGQAISKPNNYGTSQVCLTGLNAASSKIQVHGWARSYCFKVINPYAVVGTGFILNTQVPIYQPAGKNISVNSLLVDNKIGKTDQRGWIDTNLLLPETQQIIVLFRYIGKGAAPSKVQPLEASIPYTLKNKKGGLTKIYNPKPLQPKAVTPTDNSFHGENLKELYGARYQPTISDKGIVFRAQIAAEHQADFQLVGVFGLSSTKPINASAWKETIDYFQSTNDFESTSGKAVTLTKSKAVAH